MNARQFLIIFVIFIFTLILRLLVIYTIYNKNEVQFVSLLLKEKTKQCQYETNIYRIDVPLCERLTQGKRYVLTVVSPVDMTADLTTETQPFSSHTTQTDTTKKSKKRLIATEAEPYQYTYHSPKDWLWYLEEKIYSVVTEIKIQVDQNIPSSSAWLVVNSVLGYISPIPGTYDRSLDALGLQHIIAVSGSHVSFLLIMLAQLTQVFKRAHRLCILTVLLTSYWLAVGMQPSVNRAVTMGMTALVAKDYFFLQVRYLHLLVYVAFLWILIDPFSVLSVSFQLSYLATLGIILFTQESNVVSALETNRVEQIHMPGIARLVIDSFKVSLVAQVYTTSVLWYYFQQYPVLSLVANTLIFWLPPLLMFMGMLAVIMASITFLPGEWGESISDVALNTILTIPSTLSAELLGIGQDLSGTILSLPTLDTSTYISLLIVLLIVSVYKARCLYHRPKRTIELKRILYDL